MAMGDPAFRVGDRVIFFDTEKLKEVVSNYTTESALSVHQVLEPDLHLLAGKEVTIEQVSSYHMDIPLYDVSGCRAPVPEEAFFESFLRNDCPRICMQSRADDTYTASHEGERLLIKDRDDQLVCSLRKYHPEFTARRANEIASLRSRAGFESLYGFDGSYPREISNEYCHECQETAKSIRRNHDSEEGAN